MSAQMNDPMPKDNLTIEDIIPRFGGHLLEVTLRWRKGSPAWEISWEFFDEIEDSRGRPLCTSYEQGGADGYSLGDVLMVLEEKLAQETKEPK